LPFVLAVLIGVLYGSGVFLMLRRSIFKLVIGLILLGHGTNLLLFTGSGLTASLPPFLHGDQGDSTLLADPLPQALILTAIVIGLGMTAFALVLICQLYAQTAVRDFDELSENKS
jgi:multicomponent Na+:H+ antiporter subunit C